MNLPISVCLSLCICQAIAYAIPNGVSATSSAGSSAAPTGTGGGFSDSYGYGSSYAYNQQLPASNNAGFPQQQQQQFASNFPAFPFPQLPTVNFAPFGGNLPLPPLLTPDQFSEALSQYVTSVQQQYANVYEEQQKQWEAWKNNMVNAQPPQQHQQHQQQQQSGYYPPNVATATGSFGPNGIHQSATLNPENPNAPNVQTHYQASGVPGGFVGVSTSSFSSSSDVNGVKTQRKSAVTTVNDNGKITTYKLES